MPSDAILLLLLNLLTEQEHRIADLSEQVRDAGRDRLTGLANDRGLRGFVAPHENDLKAGIGHVLFVDGDGLKRINDRYGHTVGDNAIRRIADAIRGALDPGGLAARRSGDEFLALVAPGQDPADVVRRITSALERPLPVRPPAGRVTLRREAVRLTVSVGVRAVEGGVSFRTLLDDADAAMYAAKRAGRNEPGSHVAYWSPLEGDPS